MSHMLTLVTAEGAFRMEHLDTVRCALSTVDADLGAVDWLADETACDIPFAGLDAAAAEEAARQGLEGAAIDVAVTETVGRRKRLLVADLESTIIRNEMLDELAALIGVGEQVSRITAAAMNGELDFRAALAERVGLLAGQPVSLLEAAWKRLAIMPGAAALVATCRAHGVATALVSGGFHVFADRVARTLGFDEVVANRLEVKGGHLTGTVAEPILDRDAKLRVLEARCKALGITAADVIAVGDGANDLAMLGAAGLGVAFHAKPKVSATARFRVEHTDLRTLLYYQGYRASEIVGA